MSNTKDDKPRENKPKNPMGRPTKYNDQVLVDSIDYLMNCPDILPSVVGLAVHLGVCSKTLNNWCSNEDLSDFLRTLTMIKDAQHHKALIGGLTGGFNSVITKLVLANYGYHDKVDSDVTTMGKPVQNTWHVTPVSTDKDG